MPSTFGESAKAKARPTHTHSNKLAVCLVCPFPSHSTLSLSPSVSSFLCFINFHFFLLLSLVSLRFELPISPIAVCVGWWSIFFPNQYGSAGEIEIKSQRFHSHFSFVSTIARPLSPDYLPLFNHRRVNWMKTTQKEEKNIIRKPIYSSRSIVQLWPMKTTLWTSLCVRQLKFIRFLANSFLFVVQVVGDRAIGEWRRNWWKIMEWNGDRGRDWLVGNTDNIYDKMASIRSAIS